MRNEIGTGGEGVERRKLARAAPESNDISLPRNASHSIAKVGGRGIGDGNGSWLPSQAPASGATRPS